MLTLHSPKAEDTNPGIPVAALPSVAPAVPAQASDPSSVVSTLDPALRTSPDPAQASVPSQVPNPSPISEPPAPIRDPTPPTPSPREPVREIPTWPSYAISARIRLEDPQNPGRIIYLSRNIDDDGYVVYTEDKSEALIAGCIGSIHQKLLVQV